MNAAICFALGRNRVPDTGCIPTGRIIRVGVVDRPVGIRHIQAPVEECAASRKGFGRKRCLAREIGIRDLGNNSWCRGIYIPPLVVLWIENNKVIDHLDKIDGLDAGRDRHGAAGIGGLVDRIVVDDIPVAYGIPIIDAAAPLVGYNGAGILPYVERRPLRGIQGAVRVLADNGINVEVIGNRDRGARHTLDMQALYNRKALTHRNPRLRPCG